MAAADPDSRSAIFRAAADTFSTRGFDGTGVDDIASKAKVNKAMIYYHFAGKLGLYREVLRDTFRNTGERLHAIADAEATPAEKICQFIDTFLSMVSERPYMPPLMLREVAEGAPHLDADTLALLRHVMAAFGRILGEGQQAGVFRPLDPLLAYLSVVAPLLLNAARQRAGQRADRSGQPMFVVIDPAVLRTHLQDAALRVLTANPADATGQCGTKER